MDQFAGWTLNLSHYWPLKCWASEHEHARLDWVFFHLVYCGNKSLICVPTVVIIPEL